MKPKTQKKSKTAKNLKIVCIGGGNLMPKVLLEPLKKYPVQLTGLTSMVDSGGASSLFREQFDVLPPADIRRHVLALSNAPKWKKQLWTFRFGNETYGSGHKGQVLSNAFMACLEYNLKSHKKAMAIVSEFMELGDNRALPMIVDKTNIFAELENGQVLEGEREIELSENHDAGLKIKKIFQNPESRLFIDAKKAILAADIILIGPGDLYSSIAPCFLAVDA
ncbi:MAG: 2-phospho-L-lactate transferase CofD family protein, partial [Candidatus Pacebacteria bacterium]|nr:2-phospho-L-lactate transferase CofD family protein [Candidatus Paceibacterota bacterium]